MNFKATSESDEEEIVSKNRNLSKVESQRKSYVAKKLLHSQKLKDLTGRGAAFVLDLMSQLLTLPRFPICGQEPFKVRFFYCTVSHTSDFICN